MVIPTALMTGFFLGLLNQRCYNSLMARRFADAGPRQMNAVTPNRGRHPQPFTIAEANPIGVHFALWHIFTVPLVAAVATGAAFIPLTKDSSCNGLPPFSWTPRAKRFWRRDLMSGRAMSIQELAKHHNEDPAEVSRFLPFAYLAPDIVDQILNGIQPVDLTRKRSVRAGLSA